MALLEVKNLKKYYPVYNGIFKKAKSYVKAVDDVSFSIDQGETLGLVGESGCGKTTIGKTVLRLVEPTDGSINLEGKNIVSLNKKELRQERKNMQMIFQDPYSSMNPQMTVQRLVDEPLREFGIVPHRECQERVAEILHTVGLSPSDMNKYLHEFSGGQRQRIMIARALAANPKLIICDEPVSALDVSIQAQILNLMQKLQEDMGISYLFIAHGMPVVRHISNKVGVMYLGKLVETGDSETIFSHSAHPYTKALISAIPAPDPRKNSARIVLEGEVGSGTPSAGCLFCNRCPKCKPICRDVVPELKPVSNGQMVACHFPD